MLLATTLSPLKTSAAAPHMKPAAPRAAAQNEKLDFTLVNKTGYTISEVLVGSSADAEWDPSDELLQGRSFDDGEALDITFSPKVHHDHWDLKVVYEADSTSAEWGNFNLCTISEISIYYDDDTEKTTATWK